MNAFANLVEGLQPNISFPQLQSTSFFSVDPSDTQQYISFVLQYIYDNYISNGYYKELAYNTFMVWFIIEVLFYVVIELTLLPRLRAKKKPLPYYIDRIELIQRMMTELCKLNYSKEYFITGFFMEARIDEIYSDNVRSLLAWILFAERDEHLSPEERNVISRAYDIVCKHCEINFKPGYNPKIRHCALSWDDVEHIHRPFFIFVAAYLLDFLVILLAFRLQGYRQHDLYGINYWYHPGSHEGKDKTPMIFLHGITPGWAAYIMTIRSLKHGRPVFLVELHGIKVTSLEFNMPTPEEFSHTVKLMLEKHNYQTASIVGHSFGSITSSWILSHNPEIIEHLTLIDPVSLLLFLPDVAYRFVYRSPRTIIEWAIYGYARSELTISYMLARNFYWYRNVMWLEDVPPHIGLIVSVAGADEISNANVVHEYVSNFKESRKSNKSVKSAPIEILYRPGNFHGQIMFDLKEQHELSKVINRNEANSAYLSKKVSRTKKLY